MLIVLSQRVDKESDYADELYRLYHFPAQYKRQISAGDTFVYYQGDKSKRANRYYFGTGIVRNVYTRDEINYYAELEQGRKFSRKVPIYLNDGYIEQLGDNTGRKSPPWLCSIRPISQEAFDYIIEAAGGLTLIDDQKGRPEMEAELKDGIKDYFLNGNPSALQDIMKAAESLSKLANG